ncbi:methyltransferase domain-containing protein [Halomonas sp. EGI 63088]|uniref:Methyltransferase domain-containing protein n=1 Tax=Halomonas flagellata TaxID=2920385 RepID=A0ABS9RRS7_9GAMM|nr:methyltransferase domain-containing protein [Halomonas flagellata]MCH4562556.1 methyltransferase domain-containing protein [Halomonas flagellata]
MNKLMDQVAYRTYSPAVETAREYYNSDDADNFYSLVWGGEDIHVGLYHHPREAVYDASRRTIAEMATRLPGLDATTRVLDIGAGYGGSARYLAHRFGCRVTALNLSERENERGRRQNREQGVDALVEVIDGSFEDLPFDDDAFDVVWSQDAILHSGDRRKVLEEAVRVLRPGGHFIFTDPMQDDDCPSEALAPILARIHLETLGSPGFYRETLAELGLEELAFDDASEMIATHYGRIHEVLTEHEDEVAQVVSRDYIERMKRGLQHWVEGGRNGHLRWGIFLFRKPNRAAI